MKLISEQRLVDDSLTKLGGNEDLAFEMWDLTELQMACDYLGENNYILKGILMERIRNTDGVRVGVKQTKGVNALK